MAIKTKRRSGQAVQSLAQALGSARFNDPMNPNNIDESGNITSQLDDEKRTSSGRTGRETRTAAPENQANGSASPTPSAQTTQGNPGAVQGPPAPGGVQMGSAFNQGIADAFGIGNSELMSGWGIAPSGYDDMDYGTKDGANLFNYIWEQQNGNDPLMDGGDVQTLANQQLLQVMLGGGINGNSYDEMGRRYENMTSAGGTHMTLGETMNLFYNNPDALEAFGINKMDGGDINGLILGNVAPFYPTPVLSAVQARLNEDAMAYKAAQVQGYKEPYTTFLQERGTAQFLGRL